ncbi:MAG: YchJ family protein [Bdellovibrionales bacterium]|nr:YchJ family protein [Bdellovibrionales bacterium]
MLCPCQSDKDLSDCCQPIIDGKLAQTAEELMRARYTAYSQVNMDFIEKTHNPKTMKKTDMEANREWAESTQWLGLEVIHTEKGMPEDDWGKVEFRARYQGSHGENEHHEISEFHKRDGQWFFTEGKSPSRQITNDGPKVGRNDPCPCGSGKKFKKCCA